MAKTRLIHGRQLTSFIITFAFVVIAISGVILYIVPPGRVANWTNWQLLGLGKEQRGCGTHHLRPDLYHWVHFPYLFQLGSVAWLSQAAGQQRAALSQ